jgi:hypothetical protein
VGDRSRGRFATPAGFPRPECSPYSHVHAPRKFGIYPSFKEYFMSPRAKPLSVPIRNFCIAVRWERATAPRSRLYVHCGCHERAALPVQERPRCIESCASEPERLLGMCSTGQVLKVGASFCCACRTWNCTTRRFATYWRRKTASCRCELRLLTRAQLPSTRTGWEASSKEAMTISLRGSLHA